jgi:NAD(P)H-flavin reductase
MNDIVKFQFERPKMPRAKPYQARLAARQWVADETLRLEFEPTSEPMPEFLPGQYVSLRLPEDAERGLKQDMRAYSMFNHPSEEQRVVTIAKMVEGGRCTTWLRDMELGSELEFVGPMGTFWLRRPLHPHLYFVVTGTGMVPVRSMLLDMKQHGELDGRRTTVLFGVRHEGNLFGVDELQALADEHEGFTFIPTVSRPGEGWTGARGRVTAHLKDMEFPADDMQIYLCGNGAMIDEVVELVEARGLHRKTRRVVLEKYFD